MSLREAITQQERDFVRAFQDPGAYPVAVQDPGQVTRAIGVTARLEWDLFGKTFVRTVNGRFQEYWARVDFPDYRKSFLRFAEGAWSLSPRDVTGAVHVDHLVNRGFARDVGLTYLRLALLPRETNIRYGARMEKNLSNLEKSGRKVVLMDYLCLMKVFCITPPASRDDYARRRTQIAATFLSKGVAVDRDLLLQGMDGFFSLWQVV